LVGTIPVGVKLIIRSCIAAYLLASVKIAYSLNTLGFLIYLQMKPGKKRGE